MFSTRAGGRDRRGAGILAILLVAAGCAPEPMSGAVSLEAFLAALDSSTPARLGVEGIELEVSGEASAIVRLPSVRVLELDVRVDAPLYVIVGCYNHSPDIKAGPPFRAQALKPGAGRLRFDLARSSEWRPDSLPALFFEGTANLVVSAVRVASAPEDHARFEQLHDRSMRWAPESISGTTINFLTPPWWDASGSSWLPARLALLALVVGLAAGLLAARLGCCPGVRVGLVAGVLCAVLGWNLYFAQRMQPALQLVPTLDPEQRIRDNHYNAPDVGALAALARATLGPDERVGVGGSPGDWSGPRILCFQLAPRQCVILEPGNEQHAGISGVARLRLEQLDALVITESAAALPPGFVRVAEVSPRSYVARRR